MTENKLIFTGLQVHPAEGVLDNACLVVEGARIKVIDSQFEQDQEFKKIEFPSTYHLVPGFIDLHVHGANGSDVMDATSSALENMSRTLAKEGVTSFLATTMTASSDNIEKALLAVRHFMLDDDAANVQGAKILGVHLEGPFLSLKKVGAQNSNEVLMPDIHAIEHWQQLSDHAIKLVTLAPELPNSLDFIRYLQKKSIVASIGHTDATYVESMSAIEAGCTYATHLFNAMRGIHQREPGAVTAILLSEQVMAELIVDGVHLDPAIVQLALKLKGKDKIILVTDAMRAKCLCDGTYDLGGQSVNVKSNIASLADGTLAGSVLKMNSAIQNMVKFTDCSLMDAVKMASENPAKVLGVFSERGSLAEGKLADLVVLDEQYEVVMTVSEGRIVFSL
jgi:N-acetylglucosamine-6-phosphate deacetylase